MTSTRRADGSHRVVVTGMGAVSGFGIGTTALWQGIASGASAIRLVERTFDSLSISRPAAVADYRPLDHFTSSALQICEPFVQFGLIAAREAVAEAGLAGAADALAGAGVILGCGGGGELTREEAGIQLFHRRRPRAHPLTVPRTNHQAVVSQIAAEHGIEGPSFVITTGCASGSHAIVQAIQTVRHGYAERVLTGGVEANVIYAVMRAFDAARTVAHDTCRPFSLGRSGFAFGEGAGVMVIETLEAAQRRGARIHAELAGIGLSTDVADPVQPTVAGPVRALATALADAAVARHEIAYINAHGTATQLNDVIETRAVKEVFGGHAKRLAMSSTKSQIGHCFGAAGALELIVTIMGMANDTLPPTANYAGRDSDCDLDYVVEGARRQTFSTAVSQSFAFGGLNAAVVVRSAG